MNINKASFMNKGAGAILLAILAFGAAAAQDSTTTTTNDGQPSVATQVTNGEVVYVEGSDLVVKLEDGKIEHFVVPDGDKFIIDGKEVSVGELVPGTKLTQTITSTATPRYVNSVRTIEGKVFYVNAPTTVILSLPDYTNHSYKVPSHAKFIIDGEEKTIFDLQKGMQVKATVVTEDEQTVVEQTRVVYGQAPQITTTPQVGTLLFQTPSEPQPSLASAQQSPEMLPETGSSLPLIGLLGILAIVISLGLRVARRGCSL
jgi:hypothetical protein